MDSISTNVFICLTFLIRFGSPVRTEAFQDNIQIVHVLYRHGDRAPISFYPKDPHKNISDSLWPEGLGQLTKKGKAMEYVLGKWLRTRYDTFIDPVFDPDQINILSTDYDRTLMSAQCVLASFFYPDMDARFNKSISWIPTPIHTSPKDYDKILNVDSSCPRIAKELNKLENLPEVKNYLHHHQELFRYLAENSGDKIETVQDVDYLYDTLMIERLYNLTLPHWATKRFDEIKTVGDFSFKMVAYTRELKRLRGGPLLNLITTNMQKKSHGDLPNQKMLMFSAHDVTVATLLGTMGVFNNLMPPYAATVLVELHRVQNRYIVKAFYQNDSTLMDPPHPLVIPGCVEECPLNRWSQLLHDVTPIDWDRECYRPDPVRDHKFIMGLTGAIIAILVLVILVCIVYRKALATICQDNALLYQPLTTQEP